jgi:hypothetical protein
MIISASKLNVEQAAATAVSFTDNMLHLSLDDGRTISLPLDDIPWLAWLAQASQEQRDNWSIEPGGFAVYWEELDDGFEVEHVLALEKLA